MPQKEINNIDYILYSDYNKWEINLTNRTK